jgi:uncharacterized protein YicC (UPF0701 family)
MSSQHKEALALGRQQGRAVRRYLEALEHNRPRRGRRRTAESIKRQLNALEQRWESADSLTRLHLAQERRNLESELSKESRGDDLPRLEADFVATAKAYGERRGITYATWREAGVPASVLRKAGISRGR